MDKIRNFLYRFMYGRNGMDELNIFMFFIYISLYLINIFLENIILNIFVVLIVAVVFFRIYSKNLIKRRKENQYFKYKITPIKKRVKLIVKGVKDRQHKYLLCPYCGQNIRVPKGKGKIEITCPKCKRKFDNKS